MSSLSRTNKTQMITIIFDSKPTSVLCHMGDFGCGDGGWTPVMKMDGNKVRSSLCQALSRDIKASVWVFPTTSNAKIVIGCAELTTEGYHSKKKCSIYDYFVLA